MGEKYLRLIAGMKVGEQRCEFHSAPTCKEVASHYDGGYQMFGCRACIKQVNGPDVRLKFGRK